MQFFLDFLVDAVGDGFNVCIGIAFTDDEKICRCVANFAQVELNDPLSFLVADTLNNEVVELFELRLFGPLVGNTNQIEVF